MRFWWRRGSGYLWKREIGMVVEEIKVKRESRERKQSREQEEEEEEAAMIVLGMCFLAFEREILKLFVWG